MFVRLHYRHVVVTGYFFRVYLCPERADLGCLFGIGASFNFTILKINLVKTELWIYIVAV